MHAIFILNRRVLSVVKLHGAMSCGSRVSFWAVWIVAFFALCGGLVIIDNVHPRYDSQGRILRAGEGNLAKFGDTYYLYVARYPCCPVSMQPACYQPCALRKVTVAVYSSKDLSDRSWILRTSDAFPTMSNVSSPYSNLNVSYMEPSVFYSKQAKHYALWLGVESGDLRGHRVVSVSKSPIGPFEAVTFSAPNLHTGNQFEFWQEPNTGTVFAAVNMKPGFPDMPLEVVQLAPDLLSVLPNHTSGAIRAPKEAWDKVISHASAGASSIGRLEGGGIFEHGGKWFVMSGATCCFCKRGSNGFVWVSEHPLGPYKYVRDIIPWNANKNMFETEAQQFGVAPLYTESHGVVPMYIGQRAGSADDGLKCNDYQYWHPLSFDQAGLPEEIKFTDTFEVDLARQSEEAIGLVLALYNANVSTDWAKVAQAASRIPIRVIVPVPGVSPPDPGWAPTYPDDPTIYRDGIRMLQQAGIEVYAYTHLRNLSRPCCSCCGNMTQFSEWVRIIQATAEFDGVMLDNLDAPWSAPHENSQGLEEMYIPAAELVRNAGLGIWANGPHVSKTGQVEANAATWRKYLELSSFTTLFEMPVSDWLNYPGSANFSERLQWPKSQLGGYVLDISADPSKSNEDIELSLRLAVKRGLGWLYPTIACQHRTGSCTYANLPSFFSSLVDAIETINHPSSR